MPFVNSRHNNFIRIILSTFEMRLLTYSVPAAINLFHIYDKCTVYLRISYVTKDMKGNNDATNNQVVYYVQLSCDTFHTPSDYMCNIRHSCSNETTLLKNFRNVIRVEHASRPFFSSVSSTTNVRVSCLCFLPISLDYQNCLHFLNWNILYPWYILIVQIKRLFVKHLSFVFYLHECVFSFINISTVTKN